MAFCRIATRTTTETKKKKKLWLYVFVLLTVLSNNPNLHLLPLICDCRELGLCINYSRFARSPPGPEDTGNYSLWQRGSWIPADRETCWWGHNFPPKTFALTLIKPQATSILRPPFANSSPPKPPASFTPQCQRVWERGSMSFFLSSLSGRTS